MGLEPASDPELSQEALPGAAESLAAIEVQPTTYTVWAVDSLGQRVRDEGSYAAASPEAACEAHLREMGYSPDSDEWRELLAGLEAEEELRADDALGEGEEEYDEPEQDRNQLD